MQPARLRQQLGPEARDDLLNDHVFNSVLVCARPFQQMFDEGTQTPSRVQRKGRRRTFEPANARRRATKTKGDSKGEDCRTEGRGSRKQSVAGVTLRTPKLRNVSEKQPSERKSPEIPASRTPKAKRLTTTLLDTPETAAESRRGNSENSHSKHKHSKSPKLEPTAAPETRLKLPLLAPSKSKASPLSRQYAALMAQTEKYVPSPPAKRVYA